MPFVPFQNLPTLGLIFNFNATFSICSAVWSKTSFAITLLRLTKEKWRQFVWFTIISMNITMGLSALFVWIHCLPLEKTWNPTVNGTCWSKSGKVNYDIFSGVFSGFMDITLAMLPWKLVWGLQMVKKEKLGVAIAMSMGVL